MWLPQTAGGRSVAGTAPCAAVVLPAAASALRLPRTPPWKGLAPLSLASGGLHQLLYLLLPLLPLLVVVVEPRRLGWRVGSALVKGGVSPLLPRLLQGVFVLVEVWAGQRPLGD